MLFRIVLWGRVLHETSGLLECGTRTSGFVEFVEDVKDSLLLLFVAAVRVLLLLLTLLPPPVLPVPLLLEVFGFLCGTLSFDIQPHLSTTNVVRYFFPSF